MTRLELYHVKPKQNRWKGPIFFILSCMVLIVGILVFQEYWKGTIRIDAPEADLGKKVIVHMPNGQDVFTYEKLIVKKDGKTLYKGEWNTLDLTGGTIAYENWEPKK